MSYQLYRNTTLGHTLQESLDDLIQGGQMSPRLALVVLKEFDKSINNALSSIDRVRLTFKGHLNTYRLCDNVWTFIMDPAEFREQNKMICKTKVKIVACDGKAA